MGSALAAAAAFAAPGDLSLVSLSGGGVQGDQPAEAAAVSADGRYVAFTSSANLAGVATGGFVQLYLRDRVAGTTELVSSSAAGAAANASVDVENAGNVQFDLSGDGRFAVFASTATNLTPADTDPALDVYRKDMVTGEVALVSVSSGGEKANAAVGGDPSVSYDGTRVALTSGQATNLFPGDANGATSDVVVRDLVAGVTTLAAVNAAGVQANGDTERPSISADGRVVAFEAVLTANNLLPGDTGNGNDVVVRNLAAGTTAGASDPSAPNGSGFPDISGDGRFVVFETEHVYDPANDANGAKDGYRRDMVTGAVSVASAVKDADAAGNGGSDRAVVSADGGRVAFRSVATNLAGADGNAATADIFTRDPGPRRTALASVRAGGTTQGSNASGVPAISGSGGLTTFVFDDTGALTKLVEADANTRPDVHAKELPPTDPAAPSLTVSAPAEGAQVRADRVTVSGQASDPSGIGMVTVAGRAVRPDAAGAFSAEVPLALGANGIEVRAFDGSGNGASATRTVQSLPALVARPPRALGGSARLAGRRVRVTFRLTANARVRVDVLRRVVRRGPPRRVVLRRVAGVTKTLRAGRRVVLVPVGRLRAGRYTVRIRPRSAAGVSVRTMALVVRRR